MNENAKNRLIRIISIASWIALAISLVTFIISLRSRYSLQYVLAAIVFWIIVIGLKFWKQKLQGKKFRL